MKTLNLILTAAIIILSFNCFAGTGSKMSGTYTIGKSDTADFKTISAAVNALDNHGASGPVVFVVAADSYNQTDIILALQSVSVSGNVAFENAGQDNLSTTADASADVSLATK